MRTRKTDIDPGVPSFTLVATDALAVPIIQSYSNLCEDFELRDQAIEVRRALEEVIEWQKDHPDKVHLPSHQHRNLDPLPGYFALLKSFVDWFEKNDGVADDFGELIIVAQAKHYLEDWDAEKT